MRIELIGSLDYNKVKELLKEKVTALEDESKIEEIIKELQELETARKLEIVASAGKLSRFAGSVFDILGLSEEKTLEQNKKFIDRVIGMGHDSITDHDYLVFAIQDVSPVVEQTIIEERFSSFTIKSRREVNFSNVGFYVPDFHDKDGVMLPNNREIQEEYKKHMQSLFESYQELVDLGISKEDSRFVLPYSYHSNIIMGLDAHALKNLIIKLTKTKYSKIQELREFGERLYEIAKEKAPYLIPIIDNAPYSNTDSVAEYLKKYIASADYKILKGPHLLHATKNVDDNICIAAIMRKTQVDYNTAKKILKEASIKDKNFKDELIYQIAFEGDGVELSQVNFCFQIPLSLAVLTHLTRHRTHPLMTPDFSPNLDLTQYQVPPSIKANCEEKYHNIYKNNYEMYLHFKNDYGICDDDLVYFALSGTMTNSVTNFDGKTLQHISSLRECTKAQWEIRQAFNSIHKQITSLDGASAFNKVLGPSCMSQGICKEGKESCGLVYKLPNCKMPKQDD